VNAQDAAIPVHQPRLFCRQQHIQCLMDDFNQNDFAAGTVFTLSPR
jgi:hypothetical protein